MNSTPLVRLLVCGSIDRQDDGAAVWASSMLLADRPELRDVVEVVRCVQLDIEHLLQAPADTDVVIVDAAVGPPPGSVVTLGLASLATSVDAVPHSSHALPIGHVIGIAEALRGMPLSGLFVGVAGDRFGFGTSLSPTVAAALSQFVAAIGAAVDRLVTEKAFATGASRVP